MNKKEKMHMKTYRMKKTIKKNNDNKAAKGAPNQNKLSTISV